jgi:hypothetical protein
MAREKLATAKKHPENTSNIKLLRKEIGELRKRVEKYEIESLKPTFRGWHFKFSFLLPRTSQVVAPKREPLKIVFTKEDFDKLEERFYKHFEGFTHFVNVKSSIVGGWISPNKKTVINKHDRYEVYTQRREEAVEYFKKLKEDLEKKKKQMIIIIEQMEVTFVPAISSDVKNFLRKIQDLEKK